jgi:hypothetical protein
MIRGVLVYAILDDRSSPDHPLGDAIEVCIRGKTPSSSSPA